MIMRHWMDCPLTTYGRLREWRIFTRRQNDAPNADTGAVCHDIDCYGRAVVIPGVTTEPATYAEEGLLTAMCVASGEGALLLDGAVGGREYPLRPGSSFNIPPDRTFHYRYTGSVELEFIFSRRPLATSDGEFQLLHWDQDRPETEWGSLAQGHWHHTYRGPSCEVHIADLPPHKFSHPHNHTDILDEIWYVHSGQGWHWMGKEYRPHYPGWALWLDPTELHSLMNPTEENVEYIYAASWALVQDRAQDAEEAPTTIETLEEKFEAMIAAYQRTEVTIHGVDENIQPIRDLIAALKAQ